MEWSYYILAIICFIIVCFLYVKTYITRKENENHLFNLVENSKDIIYYCEVKPDLKYKYLSPSVEHYLSPNLVRESMENPYTAYERIHPEDFDILHKKLTGKLDYRKPIFQRWRDDNGIYKWFEEHATPIYKKGELVAIQGIIRNIDDKIQLKEKLEFRATHDGLTGVYNREYFDYLMGQFDKQDLEVAILLCDIDELKHVNDHYGHKEGDAIIQKFASLLNDYSNEQTIVTRIGGDEFALILKDIRRDEVEEVLESIQERIFKYNEFQKPDVPLKLSVGFAHTTSSFRKMEKLFVKADQHMYKKKHVKKQLA